MTESSLGHLPDEDHRRDAIHMAVVPVVASEPLNPGARVGLVDGEANLTASPEVGIVDPFLRIQVKKGERFWLVLLPGTVSGVRHHWSHPQFTDEVLHEAREAKLESERAGDKQVAEEWLRVFASQIGPYYEDADDAFDRLIEGLREGEVYANGWDLHSLSDIDDPDTLKRHAENYLGISIDWGEFNFRCSC